MSICSYDRVNILIFIFTYHRCVLSQLRAIGFIVPGSTGQYQWFCIISLAVIYNVTVVIARQTLTELQDYNYIMWIVLDSLCDLVYIIDMVFKARTGER